MDLGRYSAVGQGLDQVAAEEVHGDPALFPDLVAVPRADPEVGVAGVTDRMDEAPAGAEYPAHLCDQGVDLLGGRAVQSSMCVKTASTEASFAGSGSRTSCGVVVTCSARPSAAALRSAAPMPGAEHRIMQGQLWLDFASVEPSRCEGGSYFHC